MDAQKDIVDLLLMTKKAEKRALLFLFSAASLVRSIRLVVHELQLERGSSTLYLVSAGEVSNAERLCRFRTEFEALRTEMLKCIRCWLDQNQDFVLGGGVFIRLAQALSLLNGLEEVRDKVDEVVIEPMAEIEFFNALIESFLAVILEMTEMSVDGEVSKAMVALFNFMQAKEYAGQERALRALLFSRPHKDRALTELLQHRVEEQDHFFDGFAGFAQSEQVEKFKQSLICQDDFKYYRQSSVQALKGEALAQQWFEVATKRIEALHQIESELIDVLLRLCALKLQQAESALSNEQALLAGFREGVPPNSNPSNGANRPEFEFSRTADVLLEKIQIQSKHLHDVQEQLVLTKQALLERTFIERAKSLLILQKGISEQAAHKTMRETAMQSGQKMVDVAKNMLKQVGHL